MLLTIALVVLAWSAVITVVVAACANAARGDRELAASRSRAGAGPESLRLLG